MLQNAIKIRMSSIAQINSIGKFTAFDNPACLIFLF